MTNDEILKKAVTKAMGNGFVADSEWKSIPISEHYLHKYIELKQYYSLIFNHEFAQALWGEELMDVTNTNPVGEEDLVYLPAWEYHIERMVRNKEPLKYLEKNCDITRHFLLKCNMCKWHLEIDVACAMRNCPQCKNFSSPNIVFGTIEELTEYIKDFLQ